MNNKENVCAFRKSSRIEKKRSVNFKNVHECKEMAVNFNSVHTFVKMFMHLKNHEFKKYS